MGGRGTAPCGPRRTFPPSRPRGCLPTGSGGGALLNGFTSRVAAPRMAAHRAQLHAGAGALPALQPHQEGRGSWAAACPLSLPAMRGIGTAPGGPARTLPTSRPRGCPPMESSGGTPAGRLHAQGSGPEDGGTAGTAPRRGRFLPVLSPAGQPRRSGKAARSLLAAQKFSLIFSL